MNEFLPAHHAVARWAEKMPDREFLLRAHRVMLFWAAKEGLTYREKV